MGGTGEPDGPRSLAAISASHGLNHFYFLVPPMALPSIMSELGLSHYAAGLVVGAFGLTYALLQIPFGHIAEGVGRKSVILIGLLACSAGMALAGLSEGFWQLLMAHLLAGAGGATYHPAGISLVSDLFERKRGEAMGYHQTGGAIGAFASPLLTGALMASHGWRFAFLFQSAYGVLMALILQLALEEPAEKGHKGVPRGGVGFRGFGPALAFVAAATIYLLGYRGLTAFAPAFFVEKRGLDIAGSAMMFSALQVAGIFGGPICGRLSDAIGRRALLAALIAAQAALLFAITASWGWSLLFALILYGFAIFGILAIQDAFITELVPMAMRGALLGIYVASNFLTSAIVPPLAGGMIDLWGYEAAFPALSLLTLAGIPILILGTRGRRAQSPDDPARSLAKPLEADFRPKGPSR